SFRVCFLTSLHPSSSPPLPYTTALPILTFTPTVSGARTGTLSVVDNAGGSPQTVALTGSGTAPGAGFAPTSLGFGNQLLSTASTPMTVTRSEEHTSELQSHLNLVCRLLLEKKKKHNIITKSQSY